MRYSRLRFDRLRIQHFLLTLIENALKAPDFFQPFFTTKAHTGQQRIRT